MQAFCLQGKFAGIGGVLGGDGEDTGEKAG